MLVVVARNHSVVIDGIYKPPGSMIELEHIEAFLWLIRGIVHIPPSAFPPNPIAPYLPAWAAEKVAADDLKHAKNVAIAALGIT